MASANIGSWTLSHAFSFEGQEVRYEVVGAGKPLVLVHGTPFSSLVWRRIAPHVARHRQGFYYDLLGYRRSAVRSQQDVSLGVPNRVLASLLARRGSARRHGAAQGPRGSSAS